MITTAHRMESLSRAYLQAVAAQAGLNYSLHQYDYGIDITLREVEELGGHYSDIGTQLDIQLKSTMNAVETETEIKYDLDVRTYELLRSEPNFLRVLVVLLLPSSEAEWIEVRAEELCLRRCAYWYVLRGFPPTDAKASFRVSI